MNTSSLIPRIQFNFLLLAPFALALLLISFLFGCQKPEEPKETKPQVTIDNLQTAYAKSINHQRMYTRFVQQAMKEKLQTMADLYRTIARSEEIHAANHAQLLRAQSVEPQVPPVDSLHVGTVAQTLKMSLSSEGIEVESMYPNLMRTAEMEKFSEAAQQFQITHDADARQMELLKEASDRGGKIPKTQYLVCTKCGCIMTSISIEECPICHATKDKFEKI